MLFVFCLFTLRWNCGDRQFTAYSAGCCPYVVNSQLITRCFQTTIEAFLNMQSINLGPTWQLLCGLTCRFRAATSCSSKRSEFYFWVPSLTELCRLETQHYFMADTDYLWTLWKHALLHCQLLIFRKLKLASGRFNTIALGVRSLVFFE